MSDNSFTCEKCGQFLFNDSHVKERNHVPPICNDCRNRPLDRGKVLTEIEDEIDYWDKQEGGTAALIALKDLRVAINSGRLDVEEG